MKKVLAVCYRAEYMAMVIISGGRLYDWKRYRIPTRERCRALDLIAQFAADYGLTEVIAEPRATMPIPRHIHPIRIALASAKQQLMPHEARPTNRAIIQRLVNDTPTLRPLISIAAATGAVSMTRPWQIAVLLACVLALAHEAQTGELKHPTHLIY